MTEISNDPAFAHADDEQGIDLAVMVAPAVARWKSVAAFALACGVVVYAASYLIPSRYTATSVFMPPQAQSGSAGALASLGALSGLVGGNLGARNSPDQYVALMQSATIGDRMIKRFDLKKRYEVQYQVDARKRLLASTDIRIGKKDNLIQVDVTDTDPARAAAMANRYIDELRTLTNDLAITEAQQRRVFFEQLMQKTRDQLATAQIALEGSGISAGALNVEPKTAAESYARVRATLASEQVKLQVLRSTLADTAPEVRRQQETVSALTGELSKLEAEDKPQARSGDYINRYREFKYQETLFDLFSRQYESARVDESREGALIQVIDPATPPERKSGPRRSMFGLGATVAGFLLAAIFFAIRGHRARKVAEAA